MISRSARRRGANLVFVTACSLATLIAVGALALIFYSLFWHGFGGLNLKIFTMDQPASGNEGGLLDGILGSLVMCSLGMIFAVFIGILAGTWLSEYASGSRYGNIVRFLNDVLLSAPSILIGLFIYVIMVKPFGGFSGIAGAAALALLATPIVVRTTEDMLNLQPGALREAGVALGASRGLVVRQIIWRAAQTGLLTGGLLGFARISGETAPLIFTALGNNAHIHGLGDLTRPMSALPLIINQFANTAEEDLRNLAWVGALLISLAVLIVNIAGRLIAQGARKS
jgi:phosphate transport system permease protein